MLVPRTRADHIQALEAAIARVEGAVGFLYRRFRDEGRSCCPSCAFSPEYGKLCDKLERQRAWLAVLRSRAFQSGEG